MNEKHDDHAHGEHDHGHSHSNSEETDHEDHHHGHDDHESHAHSHEHDDHGPHAHSHEHHHHDLSTVGVGIVTVSSSRSLDEDAAGDSLATIFEEAGHEVSTRELVGDDYDTIQSTVDRLVHRDDVDVVVTTGGTGVTPDDVTVEAVDRLFEKRLPGFGELFRRQSYDEVGVMVVATRATAGIADGVPVFCLPGSENAARLGGEIAAEATGHLAGLARRDDEDEE